MTAPRYRILASLPFIFVYLNNIQVASPDHASHRQHLHEVLCRLHENSLTINPLKSVFGQEEVKFLGHRVFVLWNLDTPWPCAGCHPVNTPQTSTFPRAHQLFLRGEAGLLLPLTDALQGPGKSLLWSQPLDHAFNATKSALAMATELEHPQADFPISLKFDASPLPTFRLFSTPRRSLKILRVVRRTKELWNSFQSIS